MKKGSQGSRGSPLHPPIHAYTSFLHMQKRCFLMYGRLEMTPPDSPTPLFGSAVMATRERWHEVI